MNKKGNSDIVFDKFAHGLDLTEDNDGNLHGFYYMMIEYDGVIYKDTLIFNDGGRGVDDIRRQIFLERKDLLKSLMEMIHDKLPVPKIEIRKWY